MAKSKINEAHVLNVEGILDITQGQEMSIEVEEIGKKTLNELLTKFNGENVKITVRFGNDITE
jgi:head-tail adaptor